MKVFVTLSLAALATATSTDSVVSITLTQTPSTWGGGGPTATITASATASGASGSAHPTKWIPLGCYKQDPTKPILKKIPGSDTFMSIGLCTDRCASERYTYAGLHNGNECWCGNDVGGNSANPNEADCNIPCPGYALDKCGGPKALSVYMAQKGSYGAGSAPSGYSGEYTTVAGTGSAAPAKSTSSKVLSSVVVGGAMRNYGILGW